jgi:hypothetical protein
MLRRRIIPEDGILQNKRMIVHTGDEMGLVNGAELIYNSVSKSEEFLRNITSISHRKCTNECDILSMSLDPIVVTGPYHVVRGNKWK